MKIEITKNGPYLVSGSIPIREMYIIPKGHHMVLEEGRTLPQQEEYALCRCGGSSEKPFCDGAHETNHFQGTEVASKKPYLKRIQDVVEGEEISLLDDGRCAFSRFCHTDKGDVWTLTANDTREGYTELAIKSAGECVAGRLTMVSNAGDFLEDTHSPEIIILQDPAEHASAGIFVKGPVEIIGADGTSYEVRNRVALCRCGKSENLPFCDATHVPSAFNDGFLDKSRVK